MIKEAAIKCRINGKIWTGRRHGNVIAQISSEGFGPVTHEAFIQGFITDDGKFVDRKEAFKIAKECNQLLNAKEPWAEPILMSEDLY